MTSNIIRAAGIVAVALGVCAPASAAEWTVNSSLQTLYGNYNGSSQRQSMVNGGILIHADHLDTSGLSVGVNATKLSFRGGKALNQQSYFVSARHKLFFDALPGPLTLSLSGHWINNNDVTTNTDNVSVIAPQLSWINYAKTWYLDLGYARSRYNNNLHVDQYTPTLGLGFRQGADWLQLRGYLIHFSNPLRAQNKRQTSAADVKYSHWFSPGAFYKPENMQLGGLFGERMYAVDNDAAAVYNLADIQQGSLSLAAQWRLSEASSLMLMLGNERYLDNTRAERYNNRFAWLNISQNW